MIFIGMATGSVKYTNYTSGVAFNNTNVYGKNFNINGVNYDGDVGALESYTSVTNFNNGGISFNFDYDIENVKLYAKKSQSIGNATEISGATITNNKRTIEIKTSLNASSSNVYILIMVNVEEGFSITENLTGVTSDNADSVIAEDEEKTIIYTANEGYIITNISSNIGTINIAEDRKTGTVNFIATEDVVITVLAEQKYIVKLTGTFTNCYCNYSNDEVYEENKPINIIANSGYVFKDSFTYERDYATYSLTNESEAVLSANPSNGSGFIYLNDGYKAIKEIEELSTFTNIYNPTNKDLTDLSKERFITSGEGVEDLGMYITNLYILPLSIPTDLKGEDKTNIILGNYSSNVSTTILNTYEYVVDLGEITVEEKYNNVYDYINTDYILHLPFFNKIYLNSEYVVNQTIRCELIIDFYSGSGTINVYSSFTDDIIETMKTIIVTKIPFIQNSSNNVIGIISRVENLIKQVYIEVVRNKPYTVNAVFGGETIEYGKIGDYEGFVKCDNVVLNTNATSQEKEEIKNLLKNGVFIYE